jgi:hypothetical protein
LGRAADSFTGKYEVNSSPDYIYFNLNLVSTSNFKKMASFRVRIIPGFLLGRGFSAEQSHHSRSSGKKPV